MNALKTLQDRGFIYQTTHDEQLQAHLNQPRVFYVGFDPTADSLHVGSLVPIMAMLHMQRAGHRAIAILGGGTARVGDPSGKTEMRKMLSAQDIDANGAAIAAQLNRYLELTGPKGRALNNWDWLSKAGYIDFLRDVGVHFSVNRMLTAESVRQRLENGLSFIEFNYMILQAYDFYVLMRDHDCTIQMGGQDQWGNIVAGVDLCRRQGLSAQGFGITFPLITNSSGSKFGKSEQGNVWLDADRTSAFDFYQFWRNCEDIDAQRFLKLFTLLPVDEIARIASININRAKEILAYEATKLTHGPQQAAAAFATAAVRFGQADANCEVATSSDIKAISIAQSSAAPTLAVGAAELADMNWAQLYVRADLAKSNSEARRLVKGRGGRVNDDLIENADGPIPPQLISAGSFTLRAGKKRFKVIQVEEDGNGKM